MYLYDVVIQTPFHIKLITVIATTKIVYNDIKFLP